MSEAEQERAAVLALLEKLEVVADEIAAASDDTLKTAIAAGGAEALRRAAKAIKQGRHITSGDEQ